MKIKVGSFPLCVFLEFLKLFVQNQVPMPQRKKKNSKTNFCSSGKFATHLIKSISTPLCPITINYFYIFVIFIYVSLKKISFFFPLLYQIFLLNFRLLNFLHLVFVLKRVHGKTNDLLMILNSKTYIKKIAKQSNPKVMNLL